MAEGKGQVTLITEGKQDDRDREEMIKYTPEEEAQLERQHFWKVIDAFRYYRYGHLKTVPCSTHK